MVDISAAMVEKIEVLALNGSKLESGRVSLGGSEPLKFSSKSSSRRALTISPNECVRTVGKNALFSVKQEFPAAQLVKSGKVFGLVTGIIEAWT